MTVITASLVKELRDKTGLGMMDCKKALVESKGSIDDAIDSLRASSKLKAEKQASRVAAEGVLSVAISSDKKHAALVEVNCETDFVARDESFLSFSSFVSKHAIDNSITEVTKLQLGEIEEKRQALVQKIGENINIRRLEVVSGEFCAQYIHSNNKIGAIISLSGSNEEVGRDIAMHITASNPMALTKDDIDKNIVDREKEVYKSQMEGSGKPADILEKILNGKLNKFLSENSLEEQGFIKDPDVKIKDLCKKNDLKITSFSRIEVGKGIEKNEIDFADEVNSMIGK